MDFEKMARQHWTKYLPELTAALKAEGTFETEIKAAAEGAREELADLASRGAQMSATTEIVLKEYILRKPETRR